MFKTYFITIFLLMGSMSVSAADAGATAADSSAVGSTKKKAQLTPHHDEAEHDHSKHDHEKHNKVKSKSQSGKKAHDHTKHDHHDHSKHDHKQQVKMPIVKPKPTDKEYPIGVVKWPEFND